jgi:hypothetical protein
MQRLTAKELKRRYRAGERNFAGVDLSGESLRGLNLKELSCLVLTLAAPTFAVPGS